jgi:hypothetical protein
MRFWTARCGYFLHTAYNRTYSLADGWHKICDQWHGRQTSSNHETECSMKRHSCHWKALVQSRKRSVRRYKVCSWIPVLTGEPRNTVQHECNTPSASGFRSCNHEVSRQQGNSRSVGYFRRTGKPTYRHSRLAKHKLDSNAVLNNKKQTHPSLGATALREPWLPVLFTSTGPYPELSFSILQSPSLVGPLDHHLTFGLPLSLLV